MKGSKYRVLEGADVCIETIKVGDIVVSIEDDEDMPWVVPEALYNPEKSVDDYEKRLCDWFFTESEMEVIE